MQNNETGIIQPIMKIATLLHKYNKDTIVHTDAVQAIGHMRISVKELGVDMLSASAHKFNGPKGVGFLYIRKGCGVTPFIVGGGQERGYRSGTENVAGIYAMAKALEENNRNIDGNIGHVRYLETKLLDELGNRGINYTINGNIQHKASGVINLSIEKADGEGLQNALDLHGICVSVGSACNSKSKDKSYVLDAMGISDERINSAIRVSLGKDNTEDEICVFLNCVETYYKLMKMAE